MRYVPHEMDALIANNNNHSLFEVANIIVVVIVIYFSLFHVACDEIGKRKPENVANHVVVAYNERLLSVEN